jgi:DNA polymerase-4
VQAAWWADPATRRGPLAVVAEDGAILAASVDALEQGVVAGQTLPQARLRCPMLVTVPPERAVAAELWHHALTALLTLSPVVEAAAHDGAIAYLDGRGLDLLWGRCAAPAPRPVGARGLRPRGGQPGAPRPWRDTRAVARKALHILAAGDLTARAGAGPSRAVASVLARRMDASGPQVLSAEESRAFLAALPLSDPLFALDDGLRGDLHSLGLATACQLAALSHDDVATRFGPAVSAAWATARGADEPPLRAWAPSERIVAQRVLEGAVADRTVVDAALAPLCEDLDARLRAAGRATELLSLQLTCEDAPPTLRCLHPIAPLQGAAALTLAAHALWAQMQPPAPVVAFTLTATRLCRATAHQETLFGADGDAAAERSANARAARLAQVLQTHSAQFGAGRVRRPRHDPLDAEGWIWSEHEP